MIDSHLGTGPQSAMRLPVTLGEIHSTERMVPVSSRHVGGRSCPISDGKNMEWMSHLFEGGPRFRVLTPTNPCSADLERWYKLGLPEDLIRDRRKVDLSNFSPHFEITPRRRSVQKEAGKKIPSSHPSPAIQQEKGKERGKSPVS